MESRTKVIVNCETGETQIIPLTEQEIADLETARLQAEADAAAAAQAEAEKQVARQTILNRLGLTAEEAALLLS